MRFGSVPKPKDIIVIVGPSGVGKSTLIKKLMGEYPGRFGFSVSHTTRQPRPGEEHGTHYFFTPQADMQDSINSEKFIEHAKVHGNYYGTSYDAVQQVVGRGRVCVLDIDVQGAQQVKKSALNEAAVFLFVAPPSLSILEERLRGRGTESEEKVRLRLENARKEIGFAEQNSQFFDATIVSGDFDAAYKKFKDFMLAACGKERLLQSDDPSSPGWRVHGARTPRSAGSAPA